MDFGLTDDQKSLRALAREILADVATHDHLKDLESAGWSVFDRDLWQKLAAAGITGIAVPEAQGGGGLGFLELSLVFEEVGRTVAPVPAVPTLTTAFVLGAHKVATDLLGGVADGSTIVTTAFEGEVLASRDGADYVLTGEAPFVPYGAEADLVVVPALFGEGPIAGLIRRGASGVTVTELQTTNREPQALLVLDGARVAAADVVTDADDLLQDLRLHTTSALCSVAAGVCQAALDMTAKHTATREQFGKPIASFQAVGQRAADAYIDTEMVRLTALQAAWRLSEGWPATEEVAVAKFWAGDGGMRALHACQHLHGGLGVDLDYPLHRYFLWGKQIEHELGTPTRQLIALGAHLAQTPV
ncbi:MAG TPA: acyl-CoA dehydrogenase family protein [Mycobacteriales bacterium]|jgi:alkylation response protein AidB-like acyl-CoA dehydrogenase|nr:acyl-CoA dehydrogenase family protein [Mycobacteriales bacterium]